MGLTRRIRRHLRLVWQNLAIPDVSSPPFVILFINSVCNMKCGHCFYWRRLNKKDDLTFEELVSLSEQLGPIENLHLSGGEPFLRKEFASICRQFIRGNGVGEIYVPTNGYFTDKTVEQVRRTLEEKALRLLVVELSLDGMPEFHDTFRGTKNAFRKAMETYDALTVLQAEDPRLQIHAVSTAMATNIEEIRKLTTYLFDRCPEISHHNLAIIRGDWRNSSLQGPVLKEYEELARYIQRLWAPREQERYGSIVEPMLQWAKVKTAREQRQMIPCRAGVLSAVVYANGEVGVCESLLPLGNIREAPFEKIWHSPKAKELRESIAAKKCYCTNEIFMWPSITFQPLQMVRAMTGARVWQTYVPLTYDERIDWSKNTGDL
ncbi:MAG: radical SAM protein, partial [Phycisphaerales bacterium]